MIKYERKDLLGYGFDVADDRVVRFTSTLTACL